MKKRLIENFNLKRYSILIGIAIALLSSVVTMLILGFKLSFTLTVMTGIILGTLNTILLDYFARRALENSKKITVLISTYSRLIVFGIVFYFSITVFGNLGGLGAAIGFLSSYGGIIIASAIMPKSNPVCEYEPIVQYVNGRPRFMVIRNYEMTKYRDGRTYVTNRLYKKAKVITHA